MAQKCVGQAGGFGVKVRALPRQADLDETLVRGVSLACDKTRRLQPLDRRRDGRPRLGCRCDCEAGALRSPILTGSDEARIIAASYERSAALCRPLRGSEPAVRLAARAETFAPSLRLSTCDLKRSMSHVAAGPGGESER